MRGKVADPVAKNQAARITPAYAGKSTVTETGSYYAEDHPRLCGEKNFISRMKRRVSGSPPPMRGKAHVLTPLKIYGRITPAYAGKSNMYLQTKDKK